MTSLHQLLNEAVDEGSPSSFLRAAREVEKHAGELAPLKVAFLSTYTIAILDPYLRVFGALAGYRIESYFAPFQQLEQEALDSGSRLYRFDPDLVVIATRLDEILSLPRASFHTYTPAQIQEAMEAVRIRLQDLIVSITGNSNARCVLCNFADTGGIDAGPSTLALDPDPDDLLHSCNRLLRNAAQATPGTTVFDYARIVNRTGSENWLDAKLWYHARIPLSRKAQPILAEALVRHFRMVTQPPKKCLVLDLDDTLWGGVLGEEGSGGIQFGDAYPGNVFKDFHFYVKALGQQGVLLALASKNNPSDVDAVFRDRPDLILRPEDFAACEIHWDDKSESLRRIAHSLSIGTDSLVFFDDNPAEREQVRQMVQEVSVIDVPESPEHYVEAIRRPGLFDQASLSSEDRKRSSRYRDELRREETRKTTPSRDEFLRSLEMQPTITPIDEITRKRCLQLLGKTNQFNLTTRRHSEHELESLIREPNIALCLKLEDRFGDLGIIGVAIAVPKSDREWEIDSFLLSCRALGRDAEILLLRSLLDRISPHGGRRVTGRHIATPKNAQTRTFYLDNGFLPTADEGVFVLDLQSMEPQPPLVHFPAQAIPEEDDRQNTQDHC